ncbi:transcription factor 7-like 1-A isoform X5 [Platichthys flesus]|uniref:transcription factor 7-like 1-A isoform X5 n=1 Tax=Platichthys flesus TaxID=8260 RepID=UPI002DBA13BA|nr:transcription factor 7-like 1-A isoform X5 [Platichthys flesus]
MRIFLPCCVFLWAMLPQSDMQSAVPATESCLFPNDTPAEEECGPQKPQTESRMPQGAAPLSLEQPVMPATEDERCPQKPQTACHMLLGAAPLKLKQPVIFAPGFLTAKTNPPLLDWYDAPAKEKRGPQQPWIECHMLLGAAPLKLKQPVILGSGFLTEKNNPPLLDWYDAPAQEKCVPQQPWTECHMPLGASPLSLQQPVRPAPGTALPRYQPPSAFQPNYFQAASFIHSQVNNSPVVSRPHGLPGTNLVPVGFINGQIVYGAAPFSAPPFAPPVAPPIAPPVASTVASTVPVANALGSRKRTCSTQPHDERMPYVKKPPNAFMLFLMEQRSNVVVEIKNSDCAAVNKHIGYKWKSLSKDEQAKYYEDAEREKRRHSQAFPDWSAGDNYAKRMKRIRRKRPYVI